MKNFLAHLTGIVFVITILIAGGCNQGIKDNAEGTTEAKEAVLTPTSKDVDIYLKDTLIEGRFHLEMYDTRDTTKKKVDSLYTVVYPGSTVTWRKAKNSNVKKVHDIHSPDVDGEFFSFGDTISLMRSLYTLDIPGDAEFDTIKYEIVFSVKNDTVDEKETSWCIDPYLRIED